MKNLVFLGENMGKKERDAASKKDAGGDNQLVFFSFGLKPNPLMV